jgi:hypothetical protein
MEQPEFAGCDGGLRFKANIEVDFYLGEKIDQKKIDIVFQCTKQYLMDIEKNWKAGNFDEIMKFYRMECNAHKHRR